MSTEVEVTTTKVAVPDGEFTLHVWNPEATTGILLIQEIWGVSDYIREVAEELAGLGYLVASPDLFWRIQPEWVGVHDEEGLKEGLDFGSRFDPDKGLDDLEATLAHLRGMTEKVGVLGFCLGGTLAYGLAARVDGLAAVVSFYGSGVPDQAGLIERIECPLQFHFGGSDPYIPREQIAKVEEAVAGRANVEMNVDEEAGHAFHNRKAPMFYQPEPAERAWRLTERFLDRNLPVG
ncbi:dienelactone hydrolase family protein [Actinomadura adrarensis]|uniref:Dienelactone hydrolase family protein n=1 Tax=Actinomadura adrarensis TaxID=1819600 RepID=A0ABW3CMP7_9ACTN